MYRGNDPPTVRDGCRRAKRCVSICEGKLVQLSKLLNMFNECVINESLASPFYLLTCEIASCVFRFGCSPLKETGVNSIIGNTYKLID